LRGNAASTTAGNRFRFMVALLLQGKSWTKNHQRSCSVLPGQIMENLYANLNYNLFDFQQQTG
jgi:hypothetical protein